MKYVHNRSPDLQLWFKQVIRELTEVRDILAQDHVQG